MKSTWTEYCELVKKYTAPCGQRAANQYLQYIDQLFRTYACYDVNTITRVFRAYLTAGYELVPQIRHPGYQSSLKQIMDMCEELLENCNQVTIDQINDFIDRAHTIVVSCKN